MEGDPEEEMGADFANGKVDNNDNKGSNEGENGDGETEKG